MGKHGNANGECMHTESEFPSLQSTDPFAGLFDKIKTCRENNFSRQVKGVNTHLYKFLFDNNCIFNLFKRILFIDMVIKHNPV